MKQIPLPSVHGLNPLLAVVLTAIIGLVYSSCYHAAEVTMPETLVNNEPAPALLDTYQVNKDGQIRLLGKLISSAELSDKIAMSASLSPEHRVVCTADPSVTVGQMARLGSISLNQHLNLMMLTQDSKHNKMLPVYLFQVTICLALFFLFFVLVLKRQTTFQINRIYLLGAVWLAIWFPIMKIYFPASSTPDLATPSYLLPGAMMSSLESVAAPQSQVNWVGIFSVLYFTGVILMTLFFLFELYKIFHLDRTGKWIRMENHRCVLSPQVKSPFSFFNTIYLPTSHGFTEEELKEVLQHESAHIAGRHSVDVILMEVACIFLWISPVIYLYRLKLREVHEFLADAAVTKGSPWEKYAHFLVAQNNPGLQHRLSNHLMYSQLKNRLIMMAQQPSSLLDKMKYAGILPLLFVALAIFSFREKQDPAKTNSPSISHTSDKVYNMYKDGLPVYTVLDNTEQPLFPGCEKVSEMEKQECSKKKLFEYVATHLKYPEELKKAGIEGKVYVKFLITNNGYVADARIQKSLHPAADKAALDLVNGMNDNVGKWTPGTKEGIPVTMEMVLPISFALGTGSGSMTIPPKADPNSIHQTDGVYTYVEEMPIFPEGMEAMYKFIYENIKYPAAAREDGISGQVIVQFVVSSDGQIRDAKVVRGIGGGCDEEVLRLINLMPKWKPGRHDGQAVPVSFTLPIKFLLQKDTPETSDTTAPSIPSPSGLQATKVISLSETAEAKANQDSHKLSISPNPAMDVILIDLFDGARYIKVFQAGGVLLSSFDLAPSDEHAQYQLDVSSYPAGQYSVQVASAKEARSALFTVAK